MSKYNITLCPYQLTNGKWKAKILLEINTVGTIETQYFYEEGNIEYGSKKEAVNASRQLSATIKKNKNLN
jgi:hypothetical protein